MKTQVWKKRGGKRQLRLLAIMLCFCLLITACPGMPGTVSVHAAAVTATPGVISSNQEWDAQTLAAGTYTINPGVTVTVSGRLTVTGNVTIKGGGRLVRASSYMGSSDTGYDGSIFCVNSGTLTLENITVDGGNVNAYGSAIYIYSGGTVNMKTDAVIQNNINMSTGSTGTHAAGGIYCEGILNINGGTIKNCRTSKEVGTNAYSHAGGGVYLKGTCKMTAGSITGNAASNGGGIYLASTGAELRLSGGVMSGNSAAGKGSGIYYSTLNAATSKVYISGNCNVKDNIYLDNTSGELYPYITSALHYPVTLSCSSTAEGKILAGGSGHTLTSVDASKISMTGTSLYSRLNKTANQIYLSATEEPEATWQEGAGGAWKTGRFTTALEKVYDGGTIKLLNAIVITEKAEITKSVTITSNDASEPCVMTRMPIAQWGNITINGGNLTLTNVIYDGNRDWIQGTEDAKKQSLIKVGNSASDTEARLTLGTGAVVRDGYKTGGSGLFAVYGTMTMNNGAVIENCEVTNNGAGTGGGIWISAAGNFIMNGGTIRDCKADGGGAAISTDGTCTLNGGSITDNTDTSKKECAVYLRNSGSGKLTLKGINITGNTYSVYNDDKSVSVVGDSTLSGSIYTTNAIMANGTAVSSLTKVYAITLPDSPTVGTVVVSGSKDTQHYQLANTGYALLPKSDGSSNLVVAQKYKVSFDKNGGNGTTNDIEVLCGGVYGQLPTPTRTGYTFDGWYTAATGGSKVTATTTVTETTAHTLHAHWTVNTYTVTYNKNSGTITNESKYTSYTYGTGLTLPTPTRTGYTFGGWYTSSALTGTAATSISSTTTGNKTYYAKWTANTYTITYNKNSGTITNESKYTSYTYGTGLTLPTPTRTGYTFGGWYTSSALTGTAATSISSTTTGNKTYYAKWTANTYTITYNKNSGTITNESKYTSYTYGTGLTLPAPTRTGYTFGGWYTSSALTGTTVTKISTTVTGDKEYWAKWTDNIAPVIGTLGYSYQPKNFWQWLIGKDSLIITVPVTEEGSGADQITYTLTPEGGTVSEETSAITNGEAEITIPADFKGTVAIVCTDKAGNTSASVTVGAGLNATGIMIEDNAPQIEFKANGGDVSAEVYDSAPNITVMVTDDKDNAISAGIASVTYQIGNSEEVAVQQDFTTSMKTNATFTIPADKIPMGETEIIVKAMDHAGNTVTTKQTVKVMADATKVEAAKKIVEETLAGCTATNDTTKQEIQEKIDTALTNAGISDVTVTVGDLNKTEATTDAAGSISVNVSIGCGSVTDNVTINKTIDKLPITDAAKVEAAKKIVEETLAGCTATNDTTKQEIQEKIDTALTNAGISDVMITVGDLNKTEATTDAAGSISGNVSIGCGNVMDSVAIDKMIDKLPITDAVKVEAAKKIVEETLAGCTATNDTTKQEIQEKIDTALTNAGISDVTVTVGDLNKTEATTDATGSISGNVSIGCGNVTDSVAIDKMIDKLPTHTHTWTWVITKAATADEEGKMKGACTCGEITTEIIPKTGDSGSGTVIVKEDKENEYNASLADKEDVKGKVSLTDTEKEHLNTGEDLVIILRLKDVNTAVDTQEKTGIWNKLETNALGTFLDIELLKQIGGTETKITETTDEIEITFEIPEHIRNTDDSVTRTYQIMRNHDGVVNILDVESYDEAAHLLTFKTDKFSTYALVYQDTAKEDKTTETDAERVAKAKKIVEKVLSEMPVANDTEKESIQQAVDDALKKSGLSDVTVVVGDLTKNPAVAGAEGRLTGVATISKGSVSDSVSISKTIAKLPEDSIITPQQQEKNDITMMAGMKVSQTDKKISISWGKVNGVDGYQVYVTYCGKDFTTKPAKIVNSASVTKVSVKKINGKKLNLERNYKVYITAYKTVNGKKVVTGKTLIGHIVGKNNYAYTNVKQVKLAKSQFTLKVGKTSKIKAKTVLMDKKKKQLSNAHAQEFRYATSSKKVAAVSKKGKITAVGKGTCTIYVYARNGYAKKIKVKVK